MGATYNSDQGFSITDPLFDREEMGRISQVLITADLSRTKAGARHVLRVPMVHAFANRPILVGLAAKFLGGTPIPFKATLFDKSSASNWLVSWHQDTALPLRARIDDAAWGPWSMKGGVLHAIAPASALATVVALRVRLDDSTLTNGPLRILPGTHSRGVLGHDEIQRNAASIAPITCVVSAGGVVAMQPLVVHASSKAADDAPRRVLHIEYAASVHLGSGIELAVG
jgi:hypothetical protein